MAKQAITFPKVKGTNVWRNDRTGTLIQRERTRGQYAVYAPSMTHGGGSLIIAVPTLAEARQIAIGVVTATLERREADHAEALDEAASREALDILASIPVDRPAEVTELLVAAELLTDAQEHLAAVKSIRKRLYDMRDNAPVAEHVGQLVRFRHDFSDALIGFEFVIDGLSIAADDGRRVLRIKHYRKGRGWTYRMARLDDLRTLPDGRPLAPHAGHDGTDAMAMLNFPITAADIA